MNPPSVADNAPLITTGFYTVHPIINGTPSEKTGSQFFGDVVYLYKDEFFVDGAYFTGFKGSFLPHHYIKTKLVHSRNVYYWQDGHDEDVTGEIQFSSISPDRLVAAVTDDKKRTEEVEFRFYGHQMTGDTLSVIPIAHRGICYQPPNNYDGIFPANTMPGFEAALSSGYKGFEFDVRVTQDKKFVVSHDEDLSAATTSHGFVKDKPLSALMSTVVIKSAFVPENKSTAHEAYIAAPMSSLKEVLDRFIDDPRLQTMVVDVKPDIDENLRAAATPDFTGLTEIEQKKILFLVRNENAAGIFRGLCPHSDIALEGSIGPEPVEELKKFYPEAVDQPRRSHNAISFGANIVLTAKSVETSSETIGRAMELSRQYQYKILLWTFAKEWRLDFLREHEFFPDFILLDIPYYQYALQQMRYAKSKQWDFSGNTVSTTKYSNPIYKRAYNTLVADFWYKSGTLLEATYGQGTPAQSNVTSAFGPLGNSELKVGRTQIDRFSPTNASLNDWYIFLSYSSSNSALSSVGANEISTKWTRFGFGRTEGLGYYGSDLSFLPYISQSLLLTKISDFGYGQNTSTAGIPTGDQEILARYPGALRLGERVLYGFKAEILSSFHLGASYETGVVYPRAVVLPWTGSYILALAGYQALDNVLGRFTDDYPVVGPIVNIAIRAGYLYGYYLLRRDNMNWPFSSEAPMRFEGLNFGIGVRF